MLARSLQTTCCLLQVRPPSVERFRSRSILPVSFGEFLRPSQKARSVPLLAYDQGGNAIGVVTVRAAGEQVG